MTFKPTEEQEAIIAQAVGTPDNLLINALAGAAKTTTLELIVKALPYKPILLLAFNKRIAEEMKKRLPANVVAKTLNSVGHSAWMGFTKKRMIVDSRKTFEALKRYIDDAKGSSRREAQDNFVETLRAVSAAKLQGYVPEGRFPQANRLISTEDFFSNLEEAPPRHVVNTILLESIQMAFQGTIDFDDQIYMSTVFGGTFPKFPLVMVDEAQDLSPINHAMLDKLVTQRIIAVGDPYQSIYAFRGADTRSMERLRERYSMGEQTLSISFRCPQAIVKKARERAPHMQWAPWAEEGSVQSPESWSAKDIPENAAIICRNNAPLFSCAMQLLKLGRGVKMVGTDLGPQLIRAMKKYGEPEMPQEKFLEEITKWETGQLAKTKKKASIADKADCLRVFASFGKTLGEAIAYAEHLFAVSGPIQLLSGHKSKGLEWDTVYHLDPWRIPSLWAAELEEKEQEQNVRYVIETRAKKNLILVDLERLLP